MASTNNKSADQVQSDANGERSEADKIRGGMGHNSRNESPYLIKRVEDIESLEHQIQALRKEQREIYADCKKQGFSTKALRAIVAERKLDEDVRVSFREDKAICRDALGMQLAMDFLGASKAPKPSKEDKPALSEVAKKKAEPKKKATPTKGKSLNGEVHSSTQRAKTSEQQATA